MKVDTILKLGSLAIGVAQDERVRELATMLHKGAKRRGFFAPDPHLLPPTTNVKQTQAAAENPAPVGQQSQPQTQSPRIPFSPKNQYGSPLGGLEKYVTMDNAKKAMEWAGTIKDILVK